MIKLLAGDCRVTLATLPERSAQTCITSPPYWGLRDYGLEPLAWGDGWLGSLGLEPTPELFVEHIVEVFRAVRRVLRDDGCMFVNMGDSYAGSGKGPTGHNGIGNQVERQGFTGVSRKSTLRNDGRAHKGPYDGEKMAQPVLGGGTAAPGYKAKDLMMIPAMVAMALRADGWYLRSQIPWLKRSAMPESVTDRPASAVEYVYLFSKSSRYYWDADAVRVQSANPDLAGRPNGHTGSVSKGFAERPDGFHPSGAASTFSATRSRRNSDWFFESWQGLLLDEQDEPLALVVNPAGYSGAHFATFPLKLVEPMVKASTSERGCCAECGAPWVRVVERGELEQLGTNVRPAPNKGHIGVSGERAANMTRDGFTPNHQYSAATVGWRPSCKHEGEPVPQTVLDPFGGSGSTGLVADRLGRNAILCELKSSYADMALGRLVGETPMFTEVSVA